MFNLAEYQVHELLYQSSTTSVLRARRIRDQRSVLLKRPGTERPESRDLARLRHEYALLHDLHIPGVIQCLGIEGQGSELTLILEDAGGTALSRLLNGPLPVEQCLQLGIDIALALGLLHAAGIIHKDINPANIVYNQTSNVVQIIDLGIASQLPREEQAASSPKLLEGTLPYLSPEQTGRTNRAVDYRSDYYALGMTLFELLTGRTAFEATDPLELVHSHIAKAPPPLYLAHPQVPAVVSDIVLKLLAKTPEERYQSTAGLVHDLRRALAALLANGGSERFPIAVHDVSPQLRIPQKLYGREAEQTVLITARQRTSSGATELVLISGEAGAGKSMLVQEAYKGIGLRDCVLVSGKFELLRRNVPYFAIAQAFRSLIRQLMMEPEQALGAWRSKIQSAVGRNGQVLLELIPELGQLLGPQPPAPELGPTESQNRFNLLLSEFVRVFRQSSRSLVLFLDDLQWADLASLQLIETLLTDPGVGYLLILLAYRDDDLDRSHPLLRSIETVRAQGVPVTAARLGPLGLLPAQQLIADALRRHPSEVAALAQYVLAKTRGNPFFLGQFLMTLYHKGLLRLDPAAGVWQWELERIAALQVTDNVVDFMVGKLRQLSTETQSMLSLAAYLGSEFSLSTLAMVAQCSAAESDDRLWPSLQEGLLVPLDASYRHLRATGEGLLGESSRYRFVHDRVQQAAYLLHSSEQREATHSRIGRLLLSELPEGAQDERLFAVVAHLNQGCALLDSPAERLMLARLNFTAGRRAKSANAYQLAAAYLAMGMQLLAADSWESEYALTFDLYSMRIESEYLSGRPEAAAPLFDTLLAQVRSKAEQAHAYGLRAILAFAAGDPHEALCMGRVGTELLGIKLPSTPAAIAAELGAELAAITARMAGRPPQELLAAPVMRDPDQLALTRILAALYAPAYVAEPALFMLLAVKHVNLSLQYGNDKMSSFSYMMYGIILSSLSRYREAYDFGSFALQLDKKINGSLDLIARLHNGFGASVGFAYESLHTCLSYLEAGHRTGLECGDFAYASYCSHNLPIFRLIIGHELPQVADEAAHLLTLMQRTKEAISINTTLVSQTFAQRLQLPFTLDGEFLPAEESFLRQMKDRGLFFAVYWLAIAKAQYYYLQERFDKALTAAQEAESLDVYAAGSIFKYERAYYHALILLALYPQMNEAARTAALEMVRSLSGIIASIAACSSVNFQQKLLLLQAEQARVLGQDLEALDAYEQALEWAKKNEFPRDEALVAELGARHHFTMGRKQTGRYYLEVSFRAYQRWGAKAKTAQLRSKYGALVDQQRGGTARRSITQTDTHSGGEGLDVQTVLKAERALASEIQLDRLLEEMLRIVLQNAGAERGVILLGQDDRMLVHGVATAQPPAVVVMPALELASYPDICAAAVNYVVRTAQPVVLSNAAESGEYINDSYVRARRIKSLLCIPAHKAGRLVAVLYLENNLTEGCFTSERIELLRMLSTQMAISIENAGLYANLERKVAERTSQLQQAQTRLLLVERETTERMLAGGFAHEVRNTLAGPSMLLEQGLGRGLAGEANGDSLPLANARRLERIYALCGDSLADDKVAELRTLLRELFESEQHVERLLNLVNNGVTRGLNLTRALLEYARTGRDAASLVPLDLVRLVQAVSEELSAEFGQQGVPLRFTAPPELPGIVGQAEGVRSALRNLLRNARDAVLDRRLSPDRARLIEVRLGCNGEELSCAVSDSGIGIPAENMERIFEPFFTTKTDIGTGLGLALVRNIMNRHQGRVTVQSEILRGTCFTLLFPIARPAAQ